MKEFLTIMIIISKNISYDKIFSVYAELVDDLILQSNVVSEEGKYNDRQNIFEHILIKGKINF